jgi:hypothetical protein
MHNCWRAGSQVDGDRQNWEWGKAPKLTCPESPGIILPVLMGHWRHNKSDSRPDQHLSVVGEWNQD